MAVTLKPLSEQVIVITGASSGIGLVTAKAAARRGAKVLLVARNHDALAEAVHDIVVAGGVADYAVADVGDPAQVEAAAARAIARFGRIDSWVNDAGVAIFAKLADLPLDDHQQMMRTNYFGVVNGVQAALPHLHAAGGALITVGSIASDIPSPLMGAYAATKHAIRGYINALRIELRADGAPISVTLIKPSGIDTPVGQHATRQGAPESLVPPLIYDPELVADAILAAAEKPIREVTVGGFGRLNVLVGTHFPALLDWMGPLMMALMSDPASRGAEPRTLYRSTEAGRERSGRDRFVRKTSVYTAAQLHPATALAVGGAAMAALAGLWFARRRAAA